MRYVVVIAASCLLLSQVAAWPVAPGTAAAIALLLASNVALSLVPATTLFAWWCTAGVLTVDTVWVAAVLRTAGAGGAEYFVLYLFVLILAAVGESVPMVAVGATLAGATTLWANPSGLWTTPVLLRLVFLVAVSLFHGYVIERIKREHARAELEAAWARRLETQVAARTTELAALYEASRAANQAKSDFMASMSHELRTPLHIVIGYADILGDRMAKTPDEVAAFGGHIRRAATGLLHLVDEVLEVGRLEAGAVRLEPRAVEVETFADDLVRREWIAPRPGVAVRWDVLAGDRRIETDPAKLLIVMTNLITNALKYTRAGEVAVTIRDRPDDGVVELRVDDTGPGIPPDRLARMREPYHESSGQAGHAIAGVGLGLAIVHRYVALLHAELRVESTVGVGTSFRLRVPHALRDAPRLDAVA